MSPLDRQLITRKSKLIEEDLTKLRDFENVSYSEYEQSLETRLQVERLLERIIGRVIDINYHILKEEFSTIPTDYYRSFTLLGEREILNHELSQELANSTGLRNALAHEYDSIDNSQIHASIKMCLHQIPQYLEIILNR